MAKSKNFFGTRHGSTKSLTFQSAIQSGKRVQVTKDRVAHISDPKTKRQLEQRLKMHFLVNFAQRFPVLKDLFPKASGGFNPFIRANLSHAALTNVIAYPLNYNGLALMDYVTSDGPLVTSVKCGFLGEDNRYGAYIITPDSCYVNDGYSPWGWFRNGFTNDLLISAGYESTISNRLNLGDTLVWFTLTKDTNKLICWVIPLTIDAPKFFSYDEDNKRFVFTSNDGTKIELTAADGTLVNYNSLVSYDIWGQSLIVVHDGKISKSRFQYSVLEASDFYGDLDSVIPLYYPIRSSGKYLNSGGDAVTIVGGSAQ